MQAPDGGKMLPCAHDQLAATPKEMDECAKVCLGKMHVDDMEFAHLNALCHQKAAGMISSFRTLSYTHSHTLSFTHLH
jgi:hypothetical protein